MCSSVWYYWLFPHCNTKCQSRLEITAAWFSMKQFSISAVTFKKSPLSAHVLRMLKTHMMYTLQDFDEIPSKVVIKFTLSIEWMQQECSIEVRMKLTKLHCITVFWESSPDTAPQHSLFPMNILKVWVSFTHMGDLD